ncbi:hypothetical protein K402DRAFT_431198 [Aulographum hederae CBS 113979]|uniref:Aminoglycoside phosphotransferase domain-containing protein n=1 Tax=Aulographum hederae CBS 113979 TaxID=1176131 RepID=A0A6G1GZS8_9PEZI|nr:hypothetical protein K402DRAFT_431198 [Aulographum hederae CBS 113979]
MEDADEHIERPGEMAADSWSIPSGELDKEAARKDTDKHSQLFLINSTEEPVQEPIQETSQGTAEEPTAKHTENDQKLHLLRGGPITLAEALDEDFNMLIRLKYPSQRFDFYLWAHLHRDEFAAVVSQHLGLRKDETCRATEDVKEWIHGSFNLCIPVYVSNWKNHQEKRVLIRIPLPYKVGESTHRGNAEEKLRTEAVTFLWLQENNSDIPIPFLWGFGFPGGRSYFQRLLAFVTRQTIPHHYIAETRHKLLDHGYLIMEYVEKSEGIMLLESWDVGRSDSLLRANFFRGLSRIILSLGQVPMSRIRSWTMDESGRLSLKNRPLLCHLQQAENEGIPTGIPRDLVYTTANSFYSDLLAVHDSRIRNQPNSIRDEDDGYAQMANLLVMRGLLQHFTARDSRSGPFVFTLTDLHGSNIFVDQNWNIKRIIDLEWACALPIEMISAPYWLSGVNVDQLTGDELIKYEEVRQQYMGIFEQEERTFAPVYGTGGTWYFDALQTLQGCFNLFRTHMQPLFDPGFERDAFTKAVAPYWAVDASRVVEDKLRDKEVYEEQVRELFRNPPHSEHSAQADAA